VADLREPSTHFTIVTRNKIRPQLSAAAVAALQTSDVRLRNNRSEIAFHAEKRPITCRK
jgi:hypothetical protein